MDVWDVSLWRGQSLNKTLKAILNFSLYVLIVLVATYLIVHYVAQRTEVIGDSMQPTLHNGDNLIVDKITYRLSDPNRFDIIVFPYQYDERTFYIKRIIGLPGETVYIDNEGDIYINDHKLDEDYGREVIKDAGVACEPIVLADDEYFVLGDNRNNSSDSRFVAVGNIKREDIIGKAWLRIYPFDSIGFIKHS